MEPTSATFGGKRWKIQWANPGPASSADCDGPREREKTIRLAPRLHHPDAGHYLLACLVHESLHAANWTLDEDWVDQTARDIARLLWRFGYRRIEA